MWNPFFTNDGAQTPVSLSGCLAAGGISCLLCLMKFLVMTLLCHQEAELAKPRLRHLCGFSRIPFSYLNPRCYCQLPGKLNTEYSGTIKWLRVSGYTTPSHGHFPWLGNRLEGTVETGLSSQTSWGSVGRHTEKFLACSWKAWTLPSETSLPGACSLMSQQLWLSTIWYKC